MDEIIKKRNKIMKKLKKKQKEIYELEYKLIELERMMVEIDNKEIIEHMTLNQQQINIIENDSKNTLVVACPGSGKTHTLTSRYIYLVTHQKINPNNIILITFTKKAGQEMFNRLKTIIPDRLPSYVGSLHGLGYRLLNLNGNKTVLDEKDVKTILKEIVEKSEIDDDDKEAIKSKISSIIDQASSDYPFNLKKAIRKFNMLSYEENIKIIYRTYRDMKKEENLIDFNDLMVLFANFLNTIRGKEYTDKIKYVFFDEYQDVNPIQNYILSKFENSNIMVVGDDAQAIYRFRGSSVKYIWDFDKSFQPNNTFYLETNYRSSRSIVNFSQNIIKNNENQFNKNVVTKNGKGIKPHVICFSDYSDNEQYKWIANDIYKKHQNGVSYNDIVILSRKNYLLNKIEHHLVGKGIPVIKHIGLSLLDKPHIKDFMSFITLIYNDKSTLHWKRVLALHPTVGIVGANEIIDSGFESPEHNDVIVNLRLLFNKIKSVKKTIDVLKIIILYLNKLWSLNKKNNLEQYNEDIKSVLNYLNNENLEEFVSNLYLNKEIDIEYDDYLYLSTIHGAKGLEWKYVYIIDMSNNNFPSITPKYYKDEIEEMDEERRLFYVASSRAKNELIITYSVNKNPERQNSLSPLIKELDDKLYIGRNLIITRPNYGDKLFINVLSYLYNEGYRTIRKQIESIESTNRCINDKLEIVNNILVKNMGMVKMYINLVIYKMIINNFDNVELNYKIDDIKINTKFVDKHIDWRDMTNDFFHLANCSGQVKEHIQNDKFSNFLIGLETKLIDYIKNIDKIDKIELDKNMFLEKMSTNISIIVHSDKPQIIILKPSYNTSTTMCMVITHLLSSYFCKKNNIDITSYCIYNPIIGDIDRFNIKKFNFDKFIPLIPFL